LPASATQFARQLSGNLVKAEIQMTGDTQKNCPETEKSGDMILAVTKSCQYSNCLVAQHTKTRQISIHDIPLAEAMGNQLWTKLIIPNRFRTGSEKGFILFLCVLCASLASPC
jgi:hypothetical protein